MTFRKIAALPLAVALLSGAAIALPAQAASPPAGTLSSQVTAVQSQTTAPLPSQVTAVQSQTTAPLPSQVATVQAQTAVPLPSQVAALRRKAVPLPSRIAALRANAQQVQSAPGLSGALPVRFATRRTLPLPVRALSSLPVEAGKTWRLIQDGGPFPYRRDGVTFENRERILPAQLGGYYKEYTVPTPGSQDRGARRLVSGTGSELYYSGDHYRSFVSVDVRR